jgi:hypothetical protein
LPTYRIKTNKIFENLDKKFSDFENKLIRSFEKAQVSSYFLAILVVTAIASFFAIFFMNNLTASTDNISTQIYSTDSNAKQKVDNHKEDFRPFRQNHPEIEPKTEAESDEKLSGVYGLNSEKIAEATEADKPKNPPKEDEKEEELAVAPEP